MKTFSCTIFFHELETTSLAVPSRHKLLNQQWRYENKDVDKATSSVQNRPQEHRQVDYNQARPLQLTTRPPSPPYQPPSTCTTTTVTTATPTTTSTPTHPPTLHHQHQHGKRHHFLPPQPSTTTTPATIAAITTSCFLHHQHQHLHD